MATYVLIHGAGDVGWYWHLVEAELRARGHDVVAPDLPCEDDSAGLPEYADAVIEAIGDRTDLVVVAQSFGGFTAPLVCDRANVDLLVLVAPMIPAPGEAPADYWANTRYQDEAGESYDDEIALFYQDVPPDLAAEALKRGRSQSEARMHEPSPLKAWPDVPTRVLLCREDRMFRTRMHSSLRRPFRFAARRTVPARRGTRPRDGHPRSDRRARDAVSHGLFGPRADQHPGRGASR